MVTSTSNRTPTSDFLGLRRGTEKGTPLLGHNQQKMHHPSPPWGKHQTSASEAYSVKQLPTIRSPDTRATQDWRDGGGVILAAERLAQEMPEEQEVVSSPLPQARASARSTYSTNQEVVLPCGP